MATIADVSIMIDPTPERLFMEVNRRAEECRFLIPFISDPDIDLEDYNPDPSINPNAAVLTMWARCLYIEPIYIGWAEDEILMKELIMDEVTCFRDEMMAVNMAT